MVGINLFGYLVYLFNFQQIFVTGEKKQIYVIPITLHHNISHMVHDCFFIPKAGSIIPLSTHAGRNTSHSKVQHSGIDLHQKMSNFCQIVTFVQYGRMLH